MVELGTGERLIEGRAPLEVFKDIDAPWCPEMVVMPAGRFLMGSPADEAGRSADESPQHEVALPAFAIGRFAVTFEEFDHYCEAVGRGKPGDEGWWRERRPVINVSWNDAQAYVAWLSDQTRKPYRLPSEAEWEYACRAGTTTPLSTGMTISTRQANYVGDYIHASGTRGGYGKQALPVGSFDPNPWGLLDMHGNVWEWVEDCWHENYEGAPFDGRVWLEKDGGNCSLRVLRGGSRFRISWDLRSANRVRSGAGLRHSGFGFRIARALAP